MSAARRRRGGQPGNKNALKTGAHTHEAKRARHRSRVKQAKLKALLVRIKRFIAARKIAPAQEVANNRVEFWKNE